MSRDRIILESRRFTCLREFSRELTHLLEHSDYRIEARVQEWEIERLSLEMEALRGLGRLKVKVERQK